MRRMKASMIVHTPILGDVISDLEHIMSRLVEETKQRVDTADHSISILLETVNRIRHEKMVNMTAMIQEAVIKEQQIPNTSVIRDETDLFDVAYDKSILISDVAGTKIPNTPFPTIGKLGDIPCPIYWYYGDKKNKPGHYMKICENVVVHIAMPDFIEHGNKESIPCYRRVRALCSPACQFVHVGERLKKAPFPGRCACATFGNKESLMQDMFKLSADDTKVMLMYSVSELLLLNIWSHHKYKTKKFSVLDRIDIL